MGQGMTILLKKLFAFVALVCVAQAAAAEPALICFGNEPSWRLDLTQADQARFGTLDGQETTYRGGVAPLAVHQEMIWRGRASGPRGGELVAFLREGACSDGMSDNTHPYAVNVSLPGGQHYRGCCRTVAPASASLENVTWRLVDLPGQTLPAAGARNALTVRFTEGRVQGFSGCNQFVGSYAVKGDQMTLSPLAGTLMACPEPAMSLDNAFRAALAGTMRVAVRGDALTLTSANNSTVLRFQREAPARLDGVSWEVNAYNNGRHAVTSPKLGTQLTLAFKDGTVSGSSGCNRFHGTFKVQGDALSIGPLGTTRMMCDEAVMTQEREFLAALASASRWAIDRGMLDIHRPDGERVLTALPAEK